MGPILRRYIFREVASPFALALLVLVTLLVLQKIIQITDWVVNHGVSLLDMIALVGSLLPFFLVLVIPMALLLATLLAVNRLSSDSEITALKAGCIGIGSLFVPVFALALLCTAATAVLNLYLVPKSTEWNEKLLFNIARSSARVAVEEKSFHELGSGLTIYVDGLNDETLSGVLIAETGGQTKRVPPDVVSIFVIAKEGHLVSNPAELSNYLLLRNGSIHITGREGIDRKIDFGRYDFRIDVEPQKEKGVERGSEFELMSVAELRRKRAEYQKKYVELSAKWDSESKNKARPYRTALTQIGLSLNEKFSLPFACLILALWGIPLGIQRPRATRHQGIVVSIGLSLVYYLMVSGGKILATRFLIGPGMAMWLPNAVVLGTGLVFLRQAARDKPLPLAETIGWALESFQKILGRLWRRNLQ